MLSNYDAKAIAAIMGLAFVRQPRPARAGRNIVIHTDDDTMLVVEVNADSRAASNRQTAVASSTFIERAVSGGLPRTALRHVAQMLAGADTAKVSALEWDVVPKTTLDRRTTRLSVVESERTERIARLFVHARRALGTDDEARDFMTTPHPELDGRSPLDVAATDLGTRRAEQILNALEYGLAL